MVDFVVVADARHVLDSGLQGVATLFIMLENSGVFVPTSPHYTPNSALRLSLSPPVPATRLNVADVHPQSPVADIAIWRHSCSSLPLGHTRSVHTEPQHHIAACCPPSESS